MVKVLTRTKLASVVFNGSTFDFQSEGEGSNPFTRSKNMQGGQVVKSEVS